MKTYRVGILGFGFMGKVHSYGYRTLPFYYDQQDFGAVITHVCTSRAETAAKAVSQLGGEIKACTDFREITENPDIDIVDVCTPNASHREALLSAISHNKHIYCDKPITATPEEAREVMAALQNYKGIGQMTLQNRCFPVTMRAKQIIDEGRIGQILEFRGSYLHSGSASPNAPLKWKLSGAAGGGVVADLGSHILDLMQYLLGKFAAVSAVTHIAYPQRPEAGGTGRMVDVDAEDNMIATILLPNGAKGTVSASKIATGCEDEVSFEIYGSKGALKLAPMDWHKLYFYDASAPGGTLGGYRGWTAIDCGQRYEAPGGFPTPKATMGWLRGHVHCLYTFLESVYTGKQLGPSLQEGCELQELLAKVKESAATKSWVEI